MVNLSTQRGASRLGSPPRSLIGDGQLTTMARSKRRQCIDFFPDGDIFPSRDGTRSDGQAVIGVRDGSTIPIIIGVDRVFFCCTLSVSGLTTTLLPDVARILGPVLFLFPSVFGRAYPPTDACIIGSTSGSPSLFLSRVTTTARRRFSFCY